MSMDITPAELDSQSVELLPTREALLGIVGVFAVNHAAAFNVASIGSVAAAAAIQNIGIVN